MPQVINETSAGGNLGAAFGQGLAGLLQNKMGDIAQRQQAAKQAQFWKGLGLPDQLAQQFGSAPESVQKSLLDRLEGVNIGGQQQPQGQGQLPSPQDMLSQLLQQPGTQTGSQPQAPGLTIGANPAERRHKETLAQQSQLHSEKLNAPLLKSIEDKAVPARQTVKLAKEALNVLNTGKAITGVAGRVTPEFLQSDEGQELISKLKQIVLTRSQLGKGVPSRLRLALEEGAKAQIWQNPKVIKSILENMINDPEILKDIANDEAREMILSQYETQPKNLKQLIAKESQKILKETKSEPNTFKELPPASEFDGKIARNPATGEKMKSVKGEWVKIEEGK